MGNPPPSTPLRSAPSDNKDAIVSPSTSFARSNADEDVADGKCGKTRKMRKRRKRKRNAGKARQSNVFTSIKYTALFLKVFNFCIEQKWVRCLILHRFSISCLNF